MHQSDQKNRGAGQASLLVLALILSAPAISWGLGESEVPSRGWKYSGSLFLLTTPEGANLPATAAEKEFPLLVRLHSDYFDFSQAKPTGDDIRFSTPEGKALPYEIEEWDAKKGSASIWVRVPTIKGNARQELKMHWGNADARSESSAPAVFSASNGYLSVFHMQDPARDELGTVAPANVGTTASEGIIGKARRLGIGQGIRCGEKITGYPSGDAPSTTEAWFRAARPNATILGWGNEGGGRGSKVRMIFQSPPHVRIDSDFADVRGESTLSLNQWIHVAHTYEEGKARVYINGRLDGATTPPRAIKSPAKMWIGGWYNNYDFVGDIDEVRVSRVARSPDWIRLQYENQKPLQTLTGLLVQPGDVFSVSGAKLEVPEGESVRITAKAGGAEKVYWIIKRAGTETVAAVDRLTFNFDSGRVTGDESLVIRFKAIYPAEVKTKDIQVTIKERIPEPVFTLSAPEKWNGRDTIEVVSKLVNSKEMEARGGRAS